jgi:L-2,4-diaminobutyrate decarboxylase
VLFRSDLGERSFECTKKLMAMPLFVCLATYGEQMFAEHVTACYDRARHFAAALEEAPDFELVTPPDANIVCFRHLPRHLGGSDRPAQNRWQAEVRARVIARGAYYLVQTQLGDTVSLRVTIINPLTTEAHLDALLAEVRAAAAELA